MKLIEMYKKNKTFSLFILNLSKLDNIKYYYKIKKTGKVVFNLKTVSELESYDLLYINNYYLLCIY